MYDRMRTNATALLLTGVSMVGSTFALTACGGDSDDSKEPQAASEPAKAIVAEIPEPDQPQNPQARETFVGAAGPSRNPYVAVVHQDGQVVVYLCDGQKFSDWFGGSVSDNRFDLRSNAGSRITGDVAADGVQGSVTLAGEEALQYEAKPAKAGAGYQGLFAGAGSSPDYKRRWIALGEGGIRGLDSNGGGTVKNGVAVSTTTGDATPLAPGGAGTAGGSGGGTAPTPTKCKNIISGGCSASCAFLQSMHENAADALIKAKTPAAKDRAFNNMHNISLQMNENNCPPDEEGE